VTGRLRRSTPISTPRRTSLLKGVLESVGQQPHPTPLLLGDPPICPLCCTPRWCGSRAQSAPDRAWTWPTPPAAPVAPRLFHRRPPAPGAQCLVTVRSFTQPARPRKDTVSGQLDHSIWFATHDFGQSPRTALSAATDHRRHVRTVGRRCAPARDPSPPGVGISACTGRAPAICRPRETPAPRRCT